MLLAMLSLAFAFGTRAAAADQVSYDRDVRPILSSKCFECHGFELETRKAGLRLDTLEGATHGPHDYAALLPGKPDASDLTLRVTATDQDDRMPISKLFLRFTARVSKGSPLSVVQHLRCAHARRKHNQEAAFKHTACSVGTDERNHAL